ncbi:hypothetical protein ACFY8C_30735 [Streptomyces flavochromogenes]|uniref:SMI1/KNR4 family protein n=1 Tax=Streptomyces flavochromogenes TaxID=68199 RepID=A0ABW6XYS7_9ACTN|nr:hypothetical protein [Streptomyces flavochromogenes]
MEFTHSMLNNMLDRIPRPSGVLYLSQDIDPHALVENLASRHGEPRTLVLDGITAPGVGEVHGAGLLGLLDGRAETVVAWAHAGHWLGAGTALDAQGDIVPVLALTPRQVHLLPAGIASQDEDWVEQLTGITSWTLPPRRPDVDWAQIEARMGTRLPRDYKRMVETFGEGAFDAYLRLNQEPWTDWKDDGLLVWAGTEHQNLYGWQIDDGDPDHWPVTVRTFDDENVPFECSTAEFVCRILLERDHPFTMAHYFDTHWFMTFRMNE